MDFSEYLINKKIDPELYKVAEPEQYETFGNQFMQMHPNSFTAQKLNLINHIRRKFPISKAPEETTVKKPIKVKPKLVPRIKK